MLLLNAIPNNNKLSDNRQQFLAFTHKVQVAGDCSETKPLLILKRKCSNVIALPISCGSTSGRSKDPPSAV